jgi:hypothetical protein
MSFTDVFSFFRSCFFFYTLLPLPEYWRMTAGESSQTLSCGALEDCGMSGIFLCSWCFWKPYCKEATTQLTWEVFRRNTSEKQNALAAFLLSSSFSTSSHHSGCVCLLCVTRVVAYCCLFTSLRKRKKEVQLKVEVFACTWKPFWQNSWQSAMKVSSRKTCVFQ